MTPRLSVLVCTLPSRMMSAMGLLHRLEAWSRNKPVELIYLGDNKSMSVGQKRNWLLMMASGDYICFVDDDDKVMPNYVSGILKAAESDADCIVFDVEISENGGPYKRVVYDKDFTQDRNFDDRYERLPNHLMPVKRELALQAKFQNISSGEDFAYARGLHCLIKTQTRINETLYYYVYDAKNSETPR